ncbi:arginase family protein [Rhodobacteraceae bacterium NNCM2]|nr:arginase family protein [Coraliihabitans acroporae]
MGTIGFMDPPRQGPFNALPSFMNVPQSADPSGSLAAILGAPFDCGMHPTRIGSRQGPAAIREQSTLVRPFQPPHAAFNPLALLNVVDCGDAPVTSSLGEESFEAIEEAASFIHQAGAAPVGFGGDGAISLPLMRAAKKRFPDLVVLHIDAHTDTYPGDGNAFHHRYNVATTFTRAAEEGTVDAEHSFHVGPRGPVMMQDVFDHTRAKGYGLISGRELYGDGLPETAKQLREALAGKPVYLCFDMDFFDPSCAPGVCTPTWGGATAREGLALLQDLAGIDFVAFDINTVSPPHDVGGMTAFLAATVALECLTLACYAPGIRSKLSDPPPMRW